MCLFRAQVYSWLVLVAFVLSLSVHHRVFAFDNGSVQPLRFTFAGDLMAHDPVHFISGYDLIFQRIRPILNVGDLNFVNIESVVSDSIPIQGFPNFNMPGAYLAAAIDAGFNAFSLANNHSFDHAIEGVKDTLETLRQQAVKRSIYYSGLKTGRDALPVITRIHANGFDIGFIALTEFSNEQWQGDFPDAYVNRLDEANKPEIIRYLAERRYEFDLLVVSYHGSKTDEYESEPSVDKQAIFRALVAAGADIVWGHHPHVPQPVEWLIAGGRRGLVLYSAGNLISAQGYAVDPGYPNEDYYWNNTADGYLYQVDMDIDHHGQLFVREARGIPVFQYILPGRDNGIVLETANSLARRPMPLVWRAYYRYRLEYLRRQFSGLPID